MPAGRAGHGRRGRRAGSRADRSRAGAARPRACARAGTPLPPPPGQAAVEAATPGTLPATPPDVRARARSPSRSPLSYLERVVGPLEDASEGDDPCALVRVGRRMERELI